MKTYPFDNRMLKIVIRSGEVKDIKFSALRQPAVKVSQSAPVAPQWQIARYKKAGSGWFGGQFFGGLAFGMNDPKDTVEETYFREMTVYMLFKRDSSMVRWTLVFPTFLAVLVSGLTFLMELENIEGRVNTVVTVLLTVVALKLTVIDLIPQLPYLTFLDKYLIVSIFLIALQGFFQIPLFYYTQHAVEEHDDDSAKFANFAAIAASAVGFLGLHYWAVKEYIKYKNKLDKMLEKHMLDLHTDADEEYDEAFSDPTRHTLQHMHLTSQ